MIKVIAILTFLCATLTATGVYWFFVRRFSSVKKRLQTASAVGTTTATTLPSEEDSLAALAERMARPINRLAPPSAAEADKLQRQLMSAGYIAPRAVPIYRATQLLSLLGLPVTTLLVCLPFPLSNSTVVLCVLGAFILGFFLPRYTLQYLIGRRQQRLRWGLADALDLMVVSMEAGLGINAAMSRVSEELVEAHREISDEFDMVNREIRFGRDRAEALHNLAHRTGVEDLRSFVSMLVQADRFGTSIGGAVRSYSESLRTKRRQRAEQAAQKAAVKLLLPLTLFLFPTLFIIILGPAVIRMLDAFTGNLAK